MPKCTHLDQVNPQVAPEGEVCKECVAEGTRPVQLRVCEVCGHVGCCDSSPGRHANRHFKETNHAIMKPLKSGNWRWCYVDEAYV
jgi:hypothetical protein